MMTIPFKTMTPWTPAYPDGLDPDLDPVVAPVHDLLDQAVTDFGDRPCLNFLGRRTSYAEVGDLVTRATKGFRQLGLRPGDRVGLCLPNCPYFVISYFAVLKAGASVVNFNPLLTPNEILDQVVDSGITMMVTLDLKALYPKVAATLRKSALRHVIVCSLSEALPPAKGMLFQLFKRSEIAPVPRDLFNVPFDLLVANGDDPRSVEIDPLNDPAVIQYTGGTTGQPKGAVLTHANLRSNTEQVRLWMAQAAPGPQKILAVLPFFHVFAMTVIQNMGVATGSELVLLPRFDLITVLKTIDAEKPTIFPAVPTIYNAINGHGKLDRYDLSSIRFCISGGAALPDEVRRKFEDLTGCVLVEGYGLTEAAPVVTCNPSWGGGRAGSIGIPLPGTEIEVRSLDHPSQPVDPGEKGEVMVRGPQVMAGYWNREAETEAVLKDGWLRTGDVGHMDADGFVFLTDRLKDVIICSGYNVYPRIIEEALYRHPAVDEVVVIGIPDDYRGEVPKAFVRLHDKVVVSERDLLTFVEQHLNPIERPVAVAFRDELPKTLIGKLSKKELVAEEAAKREALGKDQSYG
ncbi:long-chain fatty acid--CoA ligase [Magnetospira sp. QH-2]|uniref:long-chain-fatty-acid--CoA ligase n=1 Tax=Magnetospira sp. (strain QH-2) TaxID=1288970 RepID=UPI0003E8194C|nr:long-chain fatty acid--CoA ligase [Magnetospira sp. QH-2]CCQ73245.1 Long-chain-fatty-acid--CoA ligase [Magnetospira sp. QH-2]